MENDNSYEKLLKSAKNGDEEAYNILCLQFLDYIPGIMMDLKPIIDKSKVDTEDITQEGYLALCESIRNNIYLELKIQQMSTFISLDIIHKIMQFIADNDIIKKHEISKDITYNEADEFKRYLTKVNAESRYQELRTQLLQLAEEKYGREKMLRLNACLPVRYSDTFEISDEFMKIINCDPEYTKKLCEEIFTFTQKNKDKKDPHSSNNH